MFTLGLGVDVQQEKLNEAVLEMNKKIQVRNGRNAHDFVLTIARQEINVQNMNVELVAQMFKNYQSNVLFHLEGECDSCLAEPVD